ncbi:MAG TPA: WHG domain-containing protein [Mycobacteriales bacterium]|nr:WHG domain-containing protein [Mycobacteriales bacterium]
MASRVGLDRAAVVQAAIDIVDRDGVDALTMARLAASLGIRVPSLYAHVPGQTGLRRELWMWTVNDLGERLRESVMGRSGHEALAAFATAFRDYAQARPGRYQLTLSPPQPLDEAALEVGRRANSAFEAVIRSFGLTGAEAVHLGRAVRAAIHGFVALESRYSLGPENVDESFDHLLTLLARGLVPSTVAAAG